MPRPDLALAAAAVLWAGPGAVVSPRDALRPEPLAEDEYVESFTFVADLDDGTYVQVQLGVTNIGPDDRNGFCRAFVRRPGADAWSGSARVGHHWGHGHPADGGERLDVGTCSASAGAGGTVVRALLSGHTVELAYAQPAAPPDAPVAEVALDGRRYTSWIVEPAGAVSVRLEGFGPAAALSGGGFADHSRSNVPYRELARSWVRFRALRGDRKVVALARQAPDGGWTPAWMRRGDGPPLPLTGVQVVRGAGGAFTVALAGEHAGLVKTLSTVYRFASLSELGLLGRMVAPFVGNSVTYTLRARLEPPGEPPIDGILEVSVFED